MQVQYSAGSAYQRPASPCFKAMRKPVPVPLEAAEADKAGQGPALAKEEALGRGDTDPAACIPFDCHCELWDTPALSGLAAWTPCSPAVAPTQGGLLLPSVYSAGAAHSCLWWASEHASSRCTGSLPCFQAPLNLFYHQSHAGQRQLAANRRISRTLCSRAEGWQCDTAHAGPHEALELTFLLLLSGCGHVYPQGAREGREGARDPASPRSHRLFSL